MLKVHCLSASLLSFIINMPERHFLRSDSIIGVCVGGGGVGMGGVLHLV